MIFYVTSLTQESLVHASRDQILLEGDGEEERDMEDDEVFALKGMEDDDDDEEDEDEDGDEDIEPIKPASKSKSKSKRKGKEKEKELSESGQEDSEEEEETWGRGKAAYYSSNAGQIDSDDEEAIQLEEQEAKRLRAKSRDDMNDEDFGLEDPIEVAVTDSVELRIMVLIHGFSLTTLIACWMTCLLGLYCRINSRYSVTFRKQTQRVWH